MFKKLINISILLLSLLIITNCSSSEKNSTNKESLKSAFGIKFGDKFDTNQTTQKIMKNGTNLFQVNPPKKIKFFDKYYVSITPKTHQISEIHAEKIYNDFMECENAHGLLWDMFAKKYSKIKVGKQGTLTILTPDGYIMLFKCSTNKTKTSKHTIVYKNTNYTDISKKEKLELVKNNDAL